MAEAMEVKHSLVLWIVVQRWAQQSGKYALIKAGENKPLTSIGQHLPFLLIRFMMHAFDCKL